MDTELLDTFVNISKTKSFTKTAEAMYLTQSAVSNRIKQLEVLVGYSVFHRNKNKSAVELTSSGRLLLPFAIDFISEWKSVRNKIHFINNNPSISVGVIPVLQNYFYDKVESLLFDSKIINLNIVQCSIENTIDLLNNNAVDFIVSVNKPKSAGLSYATVDSIKIGLLYNHYKSSDEFIFIDWGDKFTKDFAMEFRQSDAKITTNTVSVALKAMDALGGSCYLPLIYQRKQIKHDKRSKCCDIPIYFIFKKEYHDNPIIQHIIEQISHA